MSASPHPPQPLPRAVTLSILGAAAVFILAKPLAIADLGVFMAMGRWMWEQGQLFEAEVFAFTELGRAFVNGTWLAQLAFYGAFSLGGYPLLQVLSAAAVVAGLALVALHGRQRGGRASMGTVAVALAFVLALQNLGLRPQTFSIPLFSAAWWIGDQRWRSRWAPWALAGIFALWPNLHGAFPAALGLLLALGGGAALRALRRGGVREALRDPELRRRGLLVVAAVAATCLNPYGPGIYAYVATNSELPRTRHLDEWLPAEPTSFMGVRLIASALLAAWILARRWRQGEPSRRGIPIEDLVILGAFLWLAAGSQRMILWWGLASAPIVAGHLGATLAAPTPPKPLHRRMLQGAAALWGALILAANPWIPHQDAGRVAAEGFTGLSRDVPVEAMEILEARPGGGRVFNKMMWGSYLVWRLWPRYQPFVDPRIWVFGDETWAAYLALSRAEAGWEGDLKRWGVDVLLLDPVTQGPLIDAAAASASWRILYQDPRTAAFERTDGGPVVPPSDEGSR